MQDFILTDLVDAGLLQEMQDVFALKSKIASGIVDEHGVAVTKFALATDFCEVWTKGTAKGMEACENCALRGAHMAMELGKASVYQCHAGLFDFAAPIVVDGKLYGIIVGGQVMASPPTKEHIYGVAKELGIEPEPYWEAAQKVPVVSSVELRESVSHIYSLAMILSDIASNKYQVLKANQEIGAAAQMKSDFLANMSHEIRTPMNAVIGMADMALRENLPPQAREYILQIKRSGKTLLGIINDILDFSKIESGKMDITMGEYSPMDIVNDVVDIIATRMENRDVELIMDVPPNLPGELMGDSLRIKQIITNLANNAVKFTHHGQVAIKVSCTKTGEREQELSVAVIDTGIGIKDIDLSRIFESFHQVDSKRNRNIEGTGLGLAISKQLVELMGGWLEVKSVYEVGSKFSFCIPQLQLHETETASVKEPDGIRTAGLIGNRYVWEQLKMDITRLGGSYWQLSGIEELQQLKDKDIRYLFVDMSEYNEDVHAFAKAEPDIMVILLERFHDDFKSDLENLLVFKKPLYTYSLIGLFNHEDVHALHSEDEVVMVDFEAPEAKVLVVDDNEVNLAVAVGLLAPLHMKVEKAYTGAEAIDMISAKHYDLVFMDHMMPKMDGVETTHIIRRMYPDYDNVPIIALTANAMEETKAMFLVEGMNDFLAKPIEVMALFDKVRQWLPPDKIHKTEGRPATNESQEGLAIEGLDLEAARKLMGSEAVLWDALSNYYRVIPKKMKSIQNAYETEDWHLYTVEVHALKSTSRQIGAVELADCAAMLEKAGNCGDVEQIRKTTPELLAMYGQIEQLLTPYFKKDEEEVSGEKLLTPEALDMLLDEMNIAMGDLDMDAMNAAIDHMKEYRFEGEKKVLFEQLIEAVDELAVDRGEEIVEALRKQ